MGIMKTNEQFLKELKEINPNIEPLEEYKGAHNKIKMKCKICGNKWEVKPDNLINSKQGCPKCSRDKVTKIQTKSNNEFLEELKEVKPNIIPLEEYKGANCKIKFKCKICGYEWKTTPSSIINTGCGCRKCSIKNKNDKEKAKKIKYIKPKIEECNIILISNYNGMLHKSKFKCVKCNYEWEAYPGNVVHKKSKCPKCAGNNKKTNEEFLEELEEINHNIEPIEEYNGANTKIKFRCKVCGTIWKNTPKQVLKQVYACPVCAVKNIADKQRKTNEEFLEELKKVNPNIEPIEEYNGAFGYIKVKCKICNHTWISTPDRLLNKRAGCPNLCTRHKASSTEECMFADYIKYQINLWIKQVSKNDENKKEILTNKYEIIQGKYFNAGYGKYQLDIYFPNINIGIEYDGNYWHSDKVIEKNYQINKRKFFEDLGIKVVFIRSDEWRYNTEKLLNRILSILGIYARKSNARKMYIDNNVSKYEADKLMEISHIQGKDNSSIKIGLRTKNGTLVSLMTFSKIRNIVKSKEDLEIPTYELVRYCNYPNTIINGAFGKLLKEAEKILKSMGIKRIKTFADRRFSSDTDNIYLKNGFILSKISNPNYVYVRKGLVYSRYECQKHKLKDLLGEENFDENLSEYENMTNNNFLRIFDCGNLVYYKEIR